MLGVPAANIVRLIKELENGGWLKVRRRSRPKRNLYRLNAKKTKPKE
jgi:DNA-binding PadR family transcriptional regulator